MYEGEWPFHKVGRPGVLKVNDGLGRYKCFDCGAGGDKQSWPHNARSLKEKSFE